MFSTTTSHVQKRDLLYLCYTKVTTRKNLLLTVETKRSYQHHLVWFLPIAGLFHITGFIKIFPTFGKNLSWFLNASLIVCILERSDILYPGLKIVKEKKRNRRVVPSLFDRSVIKEQTCFTYDRHIIKTYRPGIIAAVPCAIYWGLQDLIAKFYQKLSKILNTNYRR